jgi:hypothetical protein
VLPALVCVADQQRHACLQCHQAVVLVGARRHPLQVGLHALWEWWPQQAHRSSKHCSHIVAPRPTQMSCALLFLQIPEPPAAAAAAAAGPSRTGSSNAAESLQADYQAQLERCGLALVLFWARWRRGEPIVVRGCKVREGGGNRRGLGVLGGG